MLKKLSILVFVVLVSGQVEANYNFALHTDSHPWAREDPKGAQEEIDALIKIIDNKVNLTAFDPKDINGLGEWVKAHTEGGGNTLILTGITPSTIYPINNGKPDGSPLEEFLDAGNTIFNTGEYTFYTSEGPDETNGQAALPNVIDVPKAFVWMNRGPDAWAANPVEMTPTQEGKDLIPSLKEYNTSYPFHLDDYDRSPWELEIALAENDDADPRVDPAVLYNKDTGGRLGIFVQTYVGDVPHPGVSWGNIMGEFIVNYYLPEVLSVEPIDKLTTTWGKLKSSK
ncbi:MAG: hypothetical protein OXI61_10510 [Candidatus Poribacteria bacterium]|nr:hypothetical protein [Candidatus Poribacteria bacterium]